MTISYGSNGTLNVIYKDHSSYDCYSGYDFSLSDVPINDNGIITFGNDVITITVNTKTQKISVAYEDQDFIFFSDEVTYDFTSTYPPVANINDGVVRTTSNGNFHLVCRTSNNIVTYLYFTALAYVPATITLNSPDENVTMEIGETKQISVTFNEGATNKSLVYSSNNRNVATVKGTGVITAVAEGSAVITVSTSDGNSVFINVTVNAPSNNTITLSGKYDFYDGYNVEHHVEFEEEGAIIDDCYTLTLTNGQYVLDASTGYFVIEESNGTYYLHFYDEDFDFYNNGVFYSDSDEDSYELTAW